MSRYRLEYKDHAEELGTHEGDLRSAIEWALRTSGHEGWDNSWSLEQEHDEGYVTVAWPSVDDPGYELADGVSLG